MYVNLFVKGYNKLTTSEEQLKDYFQNFGIIKNIKMTQFGYAFVCYNDRESAKKAKEHASTNLFYGE